MLYLLIFSLTATVVTALLSVDDAGLQAEG